MSTTDNSTNENEAVSLTSSPSTPRVLYWGSGSPPAWRVLICLHEKKLTYKSHLLSFDSGVLKTPPMLSLNPRGLVPIFIDNDVRMYESIAIMNYLEDYYEPSLLPPKDQRVNRARALTRMEEANNVSAAAGEVVYYVRRTPPNEINEEYLKAKKTALHSELALWETYLLGNDYLAGTYPTLADFSFFPNLAYMVRLGLKLDKYPNLLQFFERMCSRPSVLNTWPPHWKDSPGLPILHD